MHVRNIKIDVEWAQAQLEANDLLEQYFGPQYRVNFGTLFHPPNHNLMRPGGTYVGVWPDPDNTRSEIEEEGTGGTESAPDQLGICNKDNVDDLEGSIGADVDEYLLGRTDKEDGEHTLSEVDFLEIDGHQHYIGSIVTTWLSSNCEQCQCGGCIRKVTPTCTDASARCKCICDLDRQSHQWRNDRIPIFGDLTSTKTHEPCTGCGKVLTHVQLMSARL